MTQSRSLHWPMQASLTVCSLQTHSDKDWKPYRHYVYAMIMSFVYAKIIAVNFDLVISEPSSDLLRSPSSSIYVFHKFAFWSATLMHV